MPSMPDGDRRSVAQEHLRVARVAGAARAARRDQRARQQRRPTCDRCEMSVATGPHHLRGRGVLQRLPVEHRPDVQILRVGDLVGGDDERTGRREAVERLAARPLRLGVLDVARRDVVDDRVAPHVVERVLGSDILRGAPDDHAELGLVVDGLAERSRPGRRRVVPAQRVRPQREHRRGGVGLQSQLARVRGVVQADREDDRRREDARMRTTDPSSGCRGPPAAAASRTRASSSSPPAISSSSTRGAPSKRSSTTTTSSPSTTTSRGSADPGRDHVGEAHSSKLPGCRMPRGAFGLHP